MTGKKRDLTPAQEQVLLSQIATPHEKPSCVNYGVDDAEKAEAGYFGDKEAERIKKLITEE